MKRCFAIFQQARLEMYKAEHNTATGAEKTVFVSKPWTLLRIHLAAVHHQRILFTSILQRKSGGPQSDLNPESLNPIESLNGGNATRKTNLNHRGQVSRCKGITTWHLDGQRCLFQRVFSEKERSKFFVMSHASTCRIKQSHILKLPAAVFHFCSQF